MPSVYYVPSGNPATRGSGLSATIRAEFTDIAAGFAVLPQTLTANELVVVNAGGTGMTTLAQSGLTVGHATTADSATTATTAGSATTATTATTVTTNANLTGPITSVGNATSIASQTGTGTTFVVSVSPALTGTPTAPTATAATNNTQIATTAYADALAAATLTLTNKRINPRIVTLTDGATPALNSDNGDVFELAAAGDRTIAVPSGSPVDGQRMTIRHLASGGARTLALNSGTNGFAFGTDITSLTQTASGKYDYIGCIWNSTSAKWQVVAVAKGY